MLIRIERDYHTQDATLALLYVNGKPSLVTREDPARADQVFIPGETCLPVGLYNLTEAHSRRFGRLCWLICSTQGAVERRRGSHRIGMFFHPGEPEVDFGGEILLGMSRQGSSVRQTDIAHREFSRVIRVALAVGEAVEVEIN